MQIVWAVLGVLLLLFVTLDIIWTTLWVDGGAGPLTNFVTSVIWKGMKKAGSTGRMMKQSGPLILFTFGNGDYAPSPGVMQILSVFLAGYGMIILSLSISYVLNVIDGVVRKRGLARDISSIGKTTEEFLTTFYDGYEFYDFSSYLNSISSELNSTASQQQAYPLLNYYHTDQPAKSVAWVLPVLADSLFVMKYGLQEEEKVDDPFIKKSLTSIDHYLESLPDNFISQKDEETPELPDYEALLRCQLPLLPQHEFRENFRKVESTRKDLYSARHESFPEKAE